MEILGLALPKTLYPNWSQVGEYETLVVYSGFLSNSDLTVSESTHVHFISQKPIQTIPSLPTPTFCTMIGHSLMTISSLLLISWE